MPQTASTKGARCPGEDADCEHLTNGGRLNDDWVEQVSFGSQRLMDGFAAVAWPVGGDGQDVLWLGGDVAARTRDAIVQR